MVILHRILHRVDVRKIILVRQLNLKSCIFPDGEVCLTQLHLNPAAIIIDYFLGTTCDDAVTGLETIVQIKAQKSEANIIVLSAWREEEIPLDNIKGHNYSYVEKNVEAFKRVEKLIRGSW